MHNILEFYRTKMYVPRENMKDILIIYNGEYDVIKETFISRITNFSWFTLQIWNYIFAGDP